MVPHIEYVNKRLGLLNYLIEVDHDAITGKIAEISQEVASRIKQLRPLPKELLERQIMLSIVDDLAWLAVSVGSEHEMVEMHRSILKCAAGTNTAWIKSQLMLNPTTRPKGLGEVGSELTKGFIETSQFFDKVYTYDQCCNQLFDLLTDKNLETISTFLKEEEL